MSRIYLPDTNVFSRYNRGLDQGLADRIESAPERLRLSSVVWFELRYGVEKRPDLGRVN
jgi:tRNA(fMet)-specific endonuclease VapC